MRVCVELDFQWTRMRHVKGKRLAAIHDGYSASYLTCIFLQFNFIVVCNSAETIFFFFIIIFGLLISFDWTLGACAAILCRGHKLSPNRSIGFFSIFFFSISWLSGCSLWRIECVIIWFSLVFVFYSFYYIFTVVVCVIRCDFLNIDLPFNGESNAHYWDGANGVEPESN